MKLCHRCKERKVMPGGYLICAVCFNQKLGLDPDYYRKTNLPYRKKKVVK